MAFTALNLADPTTVVVGTPDHYRLLRAKQAAFAACTKYRAIREYPVLAQIAPYVNWDVAATGEAVNIDALVAALRNTMPALFRMDVVDAESTWNGV